MGKITLDQSHQVLATLAVNTDWTTIDFDDSGLQDSIVRNPKEAGRQFTAFLRNGGMVVGEPKSITIARNLFNLKKFIRDGWSIQSNETDARSIRLAELNLTKVQLVTMLKDGETSIKGEKNLKRLKTSGLVRLDADIFLTLWENQHLIPESWKEKVNGNRRCICFSGTVIKDSLGNRYALSLSWNDHYSSWGTGPVLLSFDWSYQYLSAVLAT